MPSDTSIPPDVSPSDVTDEPVAAIEETSALVDRARAGDGDAFAMLFEQFHDEIYRFAARRVGDPMLAQDISGETFADAFSSIRGFQWRGAPFEAWLYKIARRRVVDALRRRDRAMREPSGEAHLADHADAVSGSMHVRALIAQLPRSERDVIELRFMEDLDVEATARRLGKRPGAVRVAQHRGISKLRRMLEAGS